MALVKHAPNTASLTTIAFALLFVSVVTTSAFAQSATNALPFVVAQSKASNESLSFDGQVEAIKQTAVASQVAGAVVAREVRAGDSVKSGQLIARIDARTAEQNAGAAQAQVTAMQASLAVAAQDLERKRALFNQKYISQAALDQAEATFKASQAQVNALAAQANAARTQTGLHTVRAPYSGVIGSVDVELGDMAMPGKPLVTLYDPQALRVVAAVPSSYAKSAANLANVKVEIAGIGFVQGARVQLLPTVDARSLTQQVRVELPAHVSGVAPGAFARVWLTAETRNGVQDNYASIRIPQSAVLRRAEMIGVYVLDKDNKPLLRQIRLGKASGTEVDVLSGIDPGERVLTDPRLALR